MLSRRKAARNKPSRAKAELSAAAHQSNITYPLIYPARALCLQRQNGRAFFRVYAQTGLCSALLPARTAVRRPERRAVHTGLSRFPPQLSALSRFHPRLHPAILLPPLLWRPPCPARRGNMLRLSRRKARPALPHPPCSAAACPRAHPPLRLSQQGLFWRSPRR